jgi:hypothetical protein
LDLIDKEATVKFVVSLQQPDGSVAGDEWGEIDTRFTYCALNCLALLDRSGICTLHIARSSHRTAWTASTPTDAFALFSLAKILMVGSAVCPELRVML